VRAGIVLVVFVVLTVVVLAGIHPSSPSASAASASATAPPHTTSTTAPKTSSTTATTAGHSTTSTSGKTASSDHGKKGTHPTTTTTTLPPGQVSVLVANASGITGAAAALSAQLQASGWNMLPPVNANSDVSTSEVCYLAGFQPEAVAIATSLHLPATAAVPYTSAVPVSPIGSAQVIVVAGPDVSGGSTSAS
jgi:hypothetical protein